MDGCIEEADEDDDSDDGCGRETGKMERQTLFKKVMLACLPCVCVAKGSGDLNLRNEGATSDVEATRDN